ncbi:MAG: DUF6502 family protein [Acidiferrobacterales bacterium]
MIVDAALKAAIRAILAPLVRYLIGRGVTYPALSDALKEVYIGAAEQHDGADPGTVSDSRMSLLTGIHRKDVKRLRTQARAGTKPHVLRPGANLAARAVAAWVSLPRFLDRDGRPRALLRRAANSRVSFETLVRAIKADVRPSVVLEELVRVGVATVEGDTVRLLKTAYVSALPEDKLAFLGANVGDHLSSALHNISGQGEAFLERAVYYEVIAREDLAAVRPALTQLSEAFLREANQRVMPLNEAARAAPGPECRRMRLGIYYYEEASRVEPGKESRRGGRE